MSTLTIYIVIDDGAHVCPECECPVRFTEQTIKRVDLEIRCQTCGELLTAESDTVQFGRQ